MKKFLNIFLCLCMLVFTSFSLCACGNTPGQPPKEETITINNLNFTEYFSLDGYLAFTYNEGNGSSASPWADYYHIYNSGSYYFSGQTGYPYKQDKNWGINDFINSETIINKDNSEKTRWKAIILKAKKDITLTSHSFIAYTFDNFRPLISVNYDILEENNNSYNKISTWQSSQYQNPYIEDINDTTIDTNKEINLTKWWNSEENYDWSAKDFIIKEGQLLSITFSDIDRIGPHFSSLGGDLSNADTLQIDRTFCIGAMSFKAKILK